MLVEIPFFKELSRQELREIERILEIKTFAPQENIFTQGAPGIGLFVVMSGSVEVLHEDEDGTLLRLSEVGPGAFFGEMSLLDDAPRTATAVAVEETELAILYRSELLALAEQQAGLGVKIVMYLSQVLAERLRRTNRSLKDVRSELEAAQQEKEPEAQSREART